MNDMLSNPALWHWASPVWGVVAATGALYGWMLAFQRRTASGNGNLTTSAMWFLAAMAFLAIAFVSPIGVLASGYLFSAHMVQHLLLLLVMRRR